MAKKFLFYGVGEGPIGTPRGEKNQNIYAYTKICLKSNAYVKTHRNIRKIWREGKYLAVSVFDGELYRFV